MAEQSELFLSLFVSGFPIVKVSYMMYSHTSIIFSMMSTFIGGGRFALMKTILS